MCRAKIVARAASIMTTPMRDDWANGLVQSGAVRAGAVVGLSPPGSMGTRRSPGVASHDVLAVLPIGRSLTGRLLHGRQSLPIGKDVR
jgi:hypothetical protein